MASLGNPRSWIPYMDSRVCSQGLCSLHCPQWCYIVYPPPPPLEYGDDDDSRPNNFSPLVIAIIGILATAFLLVSYYAVISKYCGRRENHDYPNDDEELQEDHIPSSLLHESTIGLDESLIKSITVCKYKRGDGLVQDTDCSVCLSEFEDDECVRLLPKCSHAFHLPCIDTWLKSHSTCPLCRATIFTFNASPPPQVLPATAMELPSRAEASSENGNVAVGSGNENGVVEVQEEESSHGTPTTTPSPPPPPSTAPSSAASKHSLRAFSDLGNMQGRHRIIEIRDIDEQVYESIGRSISMDHSFQSGVSVAHHVVHMMNQLEQHSQAEGIGCSNSRNEAAGPSKRASSYKRKVLHCVLSPIAMKRSFASGRFSLSKSDRARQGIIPVAV